jgi:hypothetical protein
VTFVSAHIEDVALSSVGVVVAVHACEGLSNVVLVRRPPRVLRVAVVPCCHDFDVNDQVDLPGWLERPLAGHSRSDRTGVSQFLVTSQTPPRATK